MSGIEKRVGAGKDPHISDIRVADPEELTREQLRRRVARRVGINTTTHTRFGKRALNSIYAYLKGGHYFPKRHFDTPKSPEEKEVRFAVSLVADIHPDGTILGDVPHIETHFRREELIDLVEAIEDTDDQRPAMQGEDNE